MCVCVFAPYWECISLCVCVREFVRCFYVSFIVISKFNATIFISRSSIPLIIFFFCCSLFPFVSLSLSIIRFASSPLFCPSILYLSLISLCCALRFMFFCFRSRFPIRKHIIEMSFNYICIFIQTQTHTHPAYARTNTPIDIIRKCRDTHARRHTAREKLMASIPNQRMPEWDGVHRKWKWVMEKRLYKYIHNFPSTLQAL